MKLFAFQPNGHGQKSFFVMAEDEEQAIASIDKFIEEQKANEGDVSFDDYDVDGWKTDYYKMQVFEQGQVTMNDND